VRVPGAKNSALKLIAASAADRRAGHDPQPASIADIPVMVDLVRSLGVDGDAGRWRGPSTPGGKSGHEPDPAGMAAIRASISLLGPLVGRTRRARLALPGGDKIGRAPSTSTSPGWHGDGRRRSNSTGSSRSPPTTCTAPTITLEFPSVGATENLVMAGVLADGVTVIDNAAREPEIQDLCRMLFAMGAEIDGIGTSTLRSRASTELSGVTWHTVPDRIQAGTWAVAAGVTGGEIRVEGVRPSDLTLVVPSSVPPAWRWTRSPDLHRRQGRPPRTPATSSPCPTRGSRPTCSRR
jgi:UDP-N-acetylglucosamine 1-carboxyvinyltransferase